MAQADQRKGIRMTERRTEKRESCETTCEIVLRLDKEINGNGQPGIRQELQAVREELAAMRGAADARFRYTQILLAALTIVVALLAVPSIAHSIKAGELAIPIINQHTDLQPSYTATMNAPVLARK
jgi:hypothetical protein